MRPFPKLRKRANNRIKSWRKSANNPTAKKLRLKTRLRDPFGNVLFLKRALTSLIGIATYRSLNIANKTNVEGAEYLLDLPKTNVLFISNHQTYFVDVIALYHIFCSVKWKFKNINIPIYLLMPRVKSYYIAAEETMKESGFIPKMFSYAGAVTVKRAWRHKGKDVQRNSDIKAPDKIKKALSFGWVINFPQGTTTPDAPIRKGSANLIRNLNPIVVPVELKGFDKAFDKKGVRFKNKRVQLEVKFKKPIRFGEDATLEEIQQFLEDHLLSK